MITWWRGVMAYLEWCRAQLCPIIGHGKVITTCPPWDDELGPYICRWCWCGMDPT